ncbi:MAG: SBBP repeat-containing protein [Candidatus Cloacimonetes bacterium]|nr:SBBP repeat-containing protein [Candidatus Cloacimonadota bacterium]
MRKRTFILLGLLLITVYTFAQAPDWQWATQAGGGDLDFGSGITIDDAGNSYVTGRFEGTATFGSYSLTSSGEYDIFVAKMDAIGNWQWATKAGGTGWDGGCGITIDDTGNSYVTGYFFGTATFGSYSLTSSGDSDIFVAKIDADGNWQWATKAGGTGSDVGFVITIDDAGNSYVTGFFSDTATFGSYSLTSSGGEDIFVAKIDADGNWQWATKAGGTNADFGYGITIDDAGNSYVTGFFSDTATFGFYSLNSSGGDDIFVAKMDAVGNWQWVTQAGGIVMDYGWGITIDDAGNSYVTGFFSDTATFGSYTLTSCGDSDIFVAKIDADGNWQRATQAGGISYDKGYGITIDDAGNSYVTGYFRDTATFGSYSLTSCGDSDIFVAKIDADGNWQWATQAGGTDWDYGRAITIDDAGNSYVTGMFEGTATFGSYSLTSSGWFDIFVTKLNSSVFAENEISPIINSLSNYPNPFKPSGAGRSPATTISFSVTQNAMSGSDGSPFVTLEIFNIKGRKVKQLVSNQLTSGNHSVIWNGDDDSGNSVSSGVYLYKLNVNGKTEAVKKCLLVK